MPLRWSNFRKIVNTVRHASSSYKCNTLHNVDKPEVPIKETSGYPVLIRVAGRLPDKWSINATFSINKPVICVECWGLPRLRGRGGLFEPLQTGCCTCKLNSGSYVHATATYSPGCQRRDHDRSLWLCVLQVSTYQSVFGDA
jgi:hypothetical protein